MKSLASALGLALCLSALGSSNALAYGATAVDFEVTGVNLLQGKLIDVQTKLPRCPRGAMCEPYSVARVRFNLTGCVNDVAVTSKVNRTTAGKYNVFVSGLELVNKRSEVVRCVAAPVKVVEIHLGSMGMVGKDDVKVVFADQLYSR